MDYHPLTVREETSGDTSGTVPEKAAAWDHAPLLPGHVGARGGLLLAGSEEEEEEFWTDYGAWRSTDQSASVASQPLITLQPPAVITEVKSPRLGEPLAGQVDVGPSAVQLAAGPDGLGGHQVAPPSPTPPPPSRHLPLADDTAESNEGSTARGMGLPPRSAVPGAAPRALGQPPHWVET